MVVLALFPCALVTGCKHQETAKADTRGAAALSRITVLLPIQAQVDLTIPAGTVGKINPDLSTRFDPPIHPLGTVQSMSLYGRQIPLASHDVKDGFIDTVGYGKLELLDGGFRDGAESLELRAFPADIEKLKLDYPAPTATHQ
jgi:hypothetical protein